MDNNLNENDINSSQQSKPSKRHSISIQAKQSYIEEDIGVQLIDNVQDMLIMEDDDQNNFTNQVQNEEQQEKPAKIKKQSSISSFHSVTLKQENTEILEEKPRHKYTKISIEQEANFFNTLLFYWTGKIISYAKNNYIEVEDLFQTRDDENFAYVQAKFLPHFLDPTHKYRSIVRSLYHVIKYPLLFSLVLLVLGNLLQFSGPYLMQNILNYLSPKSQITQLSAYFFALIIFIAYVMRAFMQYNNLIYQNLLQRMQHGFHLINRSAYRSISALEMGVFQKIMKLSSSAKAQLDPGKIINLASIDSLTVFNFLMFGSFLISSPIMMIGALIFIIFEMSYAALVGFALMIITQILNFWLANKMQFIRKNIQYYQDERGKTIAEFIGGIRIIKYMGLEKFVINKIQTIRKSEVKALLIDNICRSILEVFTILAPIIIIIGTFGTYVFVLKKQLTPAKALSTLGFFNLLAIPLRMFGFTLFSFANVVVSIKRLQNFSNWVEKNEKDNEANESTAIGSLQITNGFFCWDTIQVRKDLQNFRLLDDKKKKDKSENSKQQQNAKNEENFDLISGDNIKQPVLKAQKYNEELTNKDLLILKNINIFIEPGAFICIVGKVGSGKSSLGQALIGEMFKESGTLKYKGKIAYVSQQAWLLNATLKQNITFFNDYDENKYQKILKICQLEEDIKILPNGDQTEIGEKGVNLSGGQKQRVALARAVYSNSDIYLIDDCLSALDAYVGKKIFDKVLCKELKGKTIIFITHSIHFAIKADKIVVMQNGEIVEFGPTSELQQKQNSEFQKLAISLVKQEKEELSKEEEKELDQSKMPIIEKEEKTKVTKQIEKIMSKEVLALGQKIEKKQQGSVKANIYFKYFKSGGIILGLLILIFYIFSQTAIVGNDLWIGYWSDNQFSNLTTGGYIGIYGGISLIIIILTVIKGLIFAYFTKNASLHLQKDLIYSILRSPMSFFDVTPSGRILNRTNQDQSDIDITLPWTLQLTASNLFSILSFFILTGIILPIFFAFAILAIIIYWHLCMRYLKAARELKRIQAFSRAPALSIFSEVYHGNQIIRSYQKESEFMNNLEKRMNVFITSTSNLYDLSRWISIRTDLFIAFSVGCTVLLAVLAKNFNYISQGGIIGVAITSVLKVTGLISFTIKVLSDTELGMSAVERLYEYIEKKDVEKDWDKPDPSSILGQEHSQETVKQMDSKKSILSNEQFGKQYNWPQNGNISIQNVTFRYRLELPDIIHNLSVEFLQHEKVGIVGRTGSGKSTLTLALLRILEVSNNVFDQSIGKIIIDGVDISNIGLHHVRRNITIIPQDPILFSGTIKSNLDPFNQFTDDEIIETLKKTTIFEQLVAPNQIISQEGKNRFGQDSEDQKKNEQMLQKLSDEQKKLYMQVQDGGQNFSLGQRQLICISRAIILKNKILIMDEATASIDEATDHIIQTMIKTEFANTTVITIAHRINTIILYDRILVLENGKKVEFDTPWNLLNKPDSYFSFLVNENGPQFAQKMRSLAEEKHNSTAGTI